MTDHTAQLMRIEYNELTVRLVKLRNFVQTDKFAALEPGAQALLIEQRAAMEHYHDVLGRRIERHPPSPPLDEPVEIGGFDIDRDGPVSFT